MPTGLYYVIYIVNKDKYLVQHFIYLQTYKVSSNILSVTENIFYFPVLSYA